MLKSLPREILFRAKRLGDGKWLEGCLDYHPVTKLAFIRVARHIYTDSDMVRPETVGQFTGLIDKNGKKIFEGDIVKYGDTIHEVVFEQRNDTAYFGLVYSTIETLPFGHYQDLRQIEVIGNIHDNPGMMGGTHNGKEA